MEKHGYYVHPVANSVESHVFSWLNNRYIAVIEEIGARKPFACATCHKEYRVCVVYCDMSVHCPPPYIQPPTPTSLPGPCQSEHKTQLLLGGPNTGWSRAAWSSSSVKLGAIQMSSSPLRPGFAISTQRRIIWLCIICCLLVVDSRFDVWLLPFFSFWTNFYTNTFIDTTSVCCKRLSYCLAAYTTLIVLFLSYVFWQLIR